MPLPSDCTEIWHLFKASGVFGEDRMAPHSDRDHIGYLKETKEDELVTALKWCDEHLPVSCTQVILWLEHLACRTKGGVLPSWPSCRLFLGPGFRLRSVKEGS